MRLHWKKRNKTEWVWSNLISIATQNAATKNKNSIDHLATKGLSQRKDYQKASDVITTDNMNVAVRLFKLSRLVPAQNLDRISF